MSDQFTALLEAITGELSKLHVTAGSTRAADEQYEQLFEANQQLRETFYRFFRLSGATFVVADNLDGRFVMLQRGAPDAEPYPVKLSMPIAKSPAAQGMLSVAYKDDQVECYSGFINRIFQIQRGHQGLREYGDRLKLKRAPEFLEKLHPGRPMGRPAHQRDGQSTTIKGEVEYHLCTAAVLFDQIVEWRWLWWIAAHYGASHKMGDLAFELLWEPEKEHACQKYFSQTAILGQGYGDADDLPEYAIAALDDRESWPKGDDKDWESWQFLRTELDSGIRQKKSFVEDIRPFALVCAPDLPDTEIKRRVRTVHRQLCSRKGKEGLVRDLILQVHERCDAPVCPYFYFVCADGRPKEHLVVSVLRSETSPLTYFVGQSRRMHTAVVVGLASLEGDCLSGQTERAEPQMARLRQFQTALRVCADRIIDRLFIGNLVESERRSALIRSDRVLHVSQPITIPRAFVLGSFDKVKTFYSQQSRALLLVRALYEAKFLLPIGKHLPRRSPRIAVIGGGIAGMTAASALGLLRCEVTVFEESDDILLLQSSAKHRYIHPHLTEWPKRTSMLDDAQLPLLNWQANSASEVIADIRKAFDTLNENLDQSARHKKILVNKAQVDNIRQIRDGIRIYSEGAELGRFDYAVVAIGFGAEGSDPYYWQEDGLDSRVPVQGKKLVPLRIVVSGTGDGGLIDASRAALADSPGGRNFDHRRVVEKLGMDANFKRLGKILQKRDRIAFASERRAKRRSGKTNLFAVYDEAYGRLSESFRNALKALVNPMKRKDTDVYLHHRSANVFSFDSILFNRTLVFLLIKLGMIHLIEGNLTFEGQAKATDPNEQVKLKLEGEGYVLEMSCFRLIRRHGVSTGSVAERIKSLKSVGAYLGGPMAELEVASELDKGSFDWYDKHLYNLRQQCKLAG